MKPIAGIRFPTQVNPAANKAPKANGQASFKDTLKQAIGEVNDLQSEAKVSAEKFMSGEISDVHQVMIASEKASIGLELTIAVRNKLLDAYREIMRISG